MSKMDTLADIIAGMQSEYGGNGASGGEVPQSTQPIDSVLRQMGVPKRIRRILDSSEFVATNAIRCVDEWVGLDGQWILIVAGPTGTGKSIASGHWLASLNPKVPMSRSRLTRRWVSSSDLAVMDSFGDEVPRFKTEPHLVIDDIGVEFQGKSGAVASRLDSILDARYREELLTMVTTNLNLNDFIERMPDRVVDRIKDGGTWREFGGGSMR